MGKIKVEAATKHRNTPPAKVGSKERGRPLANLLARIEDNDPHLTAEKGLSSAAMRAGDLVRAMRKEAGFSQSQLADKLRLSQARISEIEAGIGKQGPTWDLMERISEACGKVLVTIAAA